MTIIVQCGNGHKLRIRDSLAGKKVRCPKCQTVVRVNQDGEARKESSEPEGTKLEPALRQLPTPLPRKKRSDRPVDRSAWKTPLLLGAGGLAVAIVVIVVARKSAPTPVVTESQSGRAEVSLVPISRPISAPAAIPIANAASSANKPANPPAILQSVEPDRRVAAVGIQRKQAEAAIAKGGVVVWDTVEPGGQRDAWNQVAPRAGETYTCQGDCIIENENLSMHVPRNDPAEMVLAAKGGVGPQAVLPISLLGGLKPRGPIAIRVAGRLGNSATVELGVEGSGREPRVACRMEEGKYWVEVQPLAKSDQLMIGLTSQFLIMPSEFGEDLICDARMFQQPQSIPLPKENFVLALQSSGNSMAVLTYPSIDQAGEVIIGTGEGVQNSGPSLNSYVSAVSAKFHGKSIFVGILPHKDGWYFNPVNKKYGASGQYPIPFKPPYPGIWRVGGRVNGRYFVSDVPDDRFLFACSLSGTLDCLFAYFNGPSANSPNLPVAPGTIYREMLERTKGSDSRLETENGNGGRALMRRKTKYRDVCNSVDDMKDTWRNKRETLETDPDYVKNLLGDCQAILERMDRRLGEYRELTEHVAAVVAQMKAKETGKDGADLRAFAAAAQRSQAKLKAIKLVPVARATNAIAKIEKTMQQQQRGRLNVSELDKTAENMRDIANHQEEQLKKLREITLKLAEHCTKDRKTAPPAAKPYVTAIGRYCRNVLRNRDPEE